MDIPPVQVQMLGRFVIRRGSQEVSVSGRSQKLCLLLAALIWERDRPLSYHELTQLLWAETGHGPNPVNALKAILHRARLCLDGLGEGSGRSLLLHRDGGLQWSPQVPLTLDAEQFSLLTHEAGQPLGEDQALALQMEALSLYQGRLLPMLDGCPWTAGRAEPLHQTYLQTVFRTLPVLERQSRWQDAAQTAGAALALEPCRDDLCLWQMRALLQLERRTEAVQVYESFQERLLSQRGVIPSDELRALCRKARQDSDPSLLTPDTLQERLAEPPFSGALLCNFDFFRVLCHAAARRAGREAAPVHSALISLSGAGDAPLPRFSLDRAMDHLQEIITGQLRQGDAVTRYGASQFIILLPQAGLEDSRKVCRRITRAFTRQFPHSPAVLSVSVQPLSARQTR